MNHKIQYYAIQYNTETIEDEKKGKERTIINKHSHDDDLPPNIPPDQRAFMMSLDADAKRRAAERKEREEQVSGHTYIHTFHSLISFSGPGQEGKRQFGL